MLFRYKAFLSYSHKSDELLSSTLQKALKNFARPFYAIRALSVFRDKTDLSANPSLWTIIENSLKESEYFILFASPESATSPWVKREIEKWLELSHGATDKFLILWTSGELAWDLKNNDFDWNKTNSLPVILENKFQDEPYYLDFKSFKGSADLSLRNPQFLDLVATLASTLHGKSKSDLIGEDVSQHRKFKLFRTGGVILLALFLLAAVIAAIIANQSANSEKVAKQDAEERRIEAERQRQIAELREKSAISLHLLESSPVDGLKLALENAQSNLTMFGNMMTQVHNTLSSALDKAREMHRFSVLSTPRSLAVTSDGDRIAIGTLNMAYVFNTEGYQTNRPLADPIDVSLTVNAITFSPDGNMIATANGVNETANDVRIWNKDGKMIAEPFKSDGGPIYAVAFSPDGKILASGGKDQTISIWDVNTKSLIRTIKVPNSVVNAIVFDINGDRIFSAGGRPGSATDKPEEQEEFNDYSIHQWKLDGTSIGKSLYGHEGSIFDLAVSPDGRYLASGGVDGSIRLWDISNDNVPMIGIPIKGHGGAIQTLAFNIDNQTFASGSNDGNIQLWNIKGEALSPPLLGHNFAVRGLAFVDEGKTLVSTGDDSTVRFWSVRNLEDPNKRTLTFHTNAAIGSKTQEVVLDSEGLTLWNSSGKKLTQIHKEPDFADPADQNLVTSLAISNDSKVIIEATSSPLSFIKLLKINKEPSFVTAGCAPHIPIEAIQLWDTSGNKIATPLNVLEKQIVLLSSDSRGHILIADANGYIQQLNHDGTPVGTHIKVAKSMPEETITAIGVSENNALLAVAISTGTELLNCQSLARIYDWKGKWIGTPLLGHTDVINAIAFSSENQMIATGSGGIMKNNTSGLKDNTVRIWDLTGNALGVPFTGHTEGISALAFIDKGQKLISIDTSGEIRTWKVGREDMLKIARERLRAFDKAEQYKKAINDGERLEKANQLSAAKKSYERATLVRPHDGVAFNQLAKIIQSEGQFEKALQAYNKAIENEPYYGIYYYNRGLLQRSLGRLQPAIEDFSHAIDLMYTVLPPGPMINNGEFSKKYHEVNQNLYRTGKADCFLNRGETHLYLSHRKESSDDFEEAFRLGLRSERLFRVLVTTRLNNGDYDGSLQIISEALKNDDKNIYFRTTRARILGITNKKVEAIQEFEQLINWFPQSDQIRLDYGSLLFDMDKPQKALEQWQKDAEIQKKPSPELLANLAAVNWTLAERCSAISHFSAIEKTSWKQNPHLSSKVRKVLEQIKEQKNSVIYEECQGGSVKQVSVHR